MTALPDWAARLNLQPHPEGGFFRETWRSELTLADHVLPDGYDEPRNAGTAILFLLMPGQQSAWHTVRSAELWMHHRGSPLVLEVGPHRDQTTTHLLGPDISAGQHPQLTVPPGHWQRARPQTAEPALVSCVVARFRLRRLHPRSEGAHGMSIPPYPGPNPGATSGRPPIKFVWPKRIAVILAGLAMLGGIGFGVKTLLHKDEPVTTSQETVQSAAPAPAPSQAPQSSTPEAAPAGQAPTRLQHALTDSAGALSSEQTAEVKSAVKSLQAARDVRMWVVYVDAFDSPPVEWARKTRSLTRMGERDAILAVATKQRQYAFLVAPAAANGSEQAVNDMRRNTIEPKLRDNDFAGAAVAAATALQALG